MIEAAIWVLEEEDNRALRAREFWTLIEARGLYNRSPEQRPGQHRVEARYRAAV
jgi:hypothetical protein